MEESKKEGKVSINDVRDLLMIYKVSINDLLQI